MHQPAIGIEFNSSGIYWFYFTVVITIIIIIRFRLIISVHLCTLFSLHLHSMHWLFLTKNIRDLQPRGPYSFRGFLPPFALFAFVYCAFMLICFQIGPYTEDRELPYWLHCRHWPHGAVIITSLSAAGGDTAGVVAALGYRCTYVCVKYDVRNELLVQKWQIITLKNLWRVWIGPSFKCISKSKSLVLSLYLIAYTNYNAVWRMLMSVRKNVIPWELIWEFVKCSETFPGDNTLQWNMGLYQRPKLTKGTFISFTDKLRGVHHEYTQSYTLTQ